MQPPPVPSSNPYATPIARVDDIAHAGQLELADRGVRLAAHLVDGFIISIPMLIVAGIVWLIMGPRTGQEPSTAFLATLGIVVCLMGLIALIINWTLLHRYGQTIAKRMFKIKVVRVDGSRCELWRFILLRAIPVGFLAAIPFLGYIVQLVDPLMIFRDDRRCLHDLIADTIVVKA